MKDLGESPWAEFVVEGGSSDGIDANALATLLTNLNRAARVVAADLMHRPAGTGRMSKSERDIAALKITSITSGSVHISLGRPEPVDGIQLELSRYQTRPVSQIDVVAALQSDLAGVNTETGMSQERRAAISDVLQSSRRLGHSLRMTCRSGKRSGDLPLEVDLSDVGAREVEPIEQGIAYGVAHMVDIEPGRSRLRIRTYEGDSLLLYVPARLINDLPLSLGKPIEARFEEHSRASTDHRRMLRSVRLLEHQEIGKTPVPRRWKQLADQHGISLTNIPANLGLIRGNFESEEELEEFTRFLDSIR